MTNSQSSGYGFVDYYDHYTADLALQNLNGRKIYSQEIKVNWAYAGSQSGDTSGCGFQIFVGDLSPEIDDKSLYTAFASFGSCTDARVMWDQNTGRSRGYGFVSFKRKEDAERALTGMNGELLGNRSIRCNWANQKVTTSSADTTNNNDLGSVLSQTPASNTTLYIGNLSPEINDDQLLRSIFEEFGPILEIRMQKDKAFAFVKFQTHEQAARAIVSVHNRTLGSKVVKCSWGKERTNSTTASTTPSYQIPVPSLAQPSYSYPQPPPPLFQQQQPQFTPATYSPTSYPYFNPYVYNQPYPYMQGYPPYDGSSGQ